MPIRLVVAVVVTTSGVVMVSPAMTGAPVTPGIAAEETLPLTGLGVTGGIGVGTAVPGVIIGVAP
jgi:hypothetical protein